MPPGFIDNILLPIFKVELKKRKIEYNSVYLSYSYERVTPGKNYINSIINGYRVYSGINKNSKKECRNFLEKIINSNKYPLTELENITAAEIAKTMENSYRAVNIAFIEEWTILSEKLNINLKKIIDTIKLRPTHRNMMYPGFGVGGYCLTKDPLLPESSAKYIFKNKNLKFKFSKLAIKTNNSMPIRSFKLINSNLKNRINNKKILLKGFNKNIYSYMKKSKAFILSSLWEDPGFVMIEGAASNAFIISSNCKNGPKEFLSYGDAGLLYDSNISGKLSQKLKEFLKLDDKIINLISQINKLNGKISFSEENKNLYIKKLENYLDNLKNKSILSNEENNKIEETNINGINFVSQLIENLPPKELRSIFDKFKLEKSKSILACITTNEDKVSIVVGLTNDLIDTYDARVLIKSTFDLLGSKGGGGRIDFAQAGGNKKDQLNQAFLSIKNQI